MTLPRYVALFLALCLAPTPVLALTYAKRLCQSYPEVYACLTAQELAAELMTTPTSWVSLLPDKQDRVFVQQLNRSTRLTSRTLLAVPHDRVFDIAQHTPFPAYDQTILVRTLIYDPKVLAWALYEYDGTLMRWGLGIGGASWCGDIKRGCRTRVGTFAIRAKHGANHRSSKYPIGCRGAGCAPTPYMLTFDSAGYGFHASKDLPGQHASHGCVRLLYDDAQWLHGKVGVGTRVIVQPY